MRFMNKCIIALSCASAWLYQSCTDSSDHIFDETDTTEIQIDATLSKTMVATTPSVKADTFNIHDTIYFLTTISPNKIVRVQDYHWLMDGVYCSSEYNFKKQILEPGYHKFKFVLKDYFGDMHYDSLDVWIADSPILNDTAFIPAQGTQAIDPYETIYFTWDAHTEGIRLAHHFHFTLSEEIFANSGTTKSSFKGIDTILNEPHFEFHNKLNPLRKYIWTVQAFNEYNLSSAEKIESYFYTKGLPKEGSLQTSFNISQQSSLPMQLSLMDKRDEDKVFKYNFLISQSSNELLLDAIPAGAYQLTLSSDYSDFGIIKKDINIRDGFVTILDNIKLTDSIPPSITSVSNLDTLDFSDTLQFIIKDGSGAINAQNTSVHLGSELIPDSFYKDSILTVILKESDKNWTYLILTISATDGSMNTSAKSFYINPSLFWFTTNSDTTIASNGKIQLFIKDNNQFDFKVETLKFFNVTKNEDIVSISNSGKNFFTAELDASLFDNEQIIESIIIYSNGIKQSKKWKLRVKRTELKEEN